MGELASEAKDDLESKLEQSVQDGKKYIAVIYSDGDIAFQVEGLNMDEALILLKKGLVKFDKMHFKQLFVEIDA